MRQAPGADDRDFRRCVIAGLKAYDVDGDLVGTVEMVDETMGTMRVATNPFFEEPLVVPLDLIVSMNSRELFLSAARRTLRQKEVKPREQPA